MNSIMLDDFCNILKAGRTPLEKLLPGELARRFVGHFGVSPFPRMGEMVRVLKEAGIETVPDANLDKGLRGMHLGTSHGTYVIRYDASETEGTQEHTVFHETYEIIRERLTDLHPEIQRPQGQPLCRQADRFAAAALMQPGFFALFAETTGLDVMALQRTYGRAYSSLTIRLAEVMRNQPLLAVLYERQGHRDPQEWAEHPSPEEFTATVVARTPGFRLRAVKRPLATLRGLLPRRGYPPRSVLGGGAGHSHGRTRIRGTGHRLRPMECRRHHRGRQTGEMAWPPGQDRRRSRALQGPKGSGPADQPCLLRANLPCSSGYLALI